MICLLDIENINSRFSAEVDQTSKTATNKCLSVTVHSYRWFKVIQSQLNVSKERVIMKDQMREEAAEKEKLNRW